MKERWMSRNYHCLGFGDSHRDSGDGSCYPIRDGWIKWRQTHALHSTSSQSCYLCNVHVKFPWTDMFSISVRCFTRQPINSCVALTHAYMQSVGLSLTQTSADSTSEPAHKHVLNAKPLKSTHDNIVNTKDGLLVWCLEIFCRQPIVIESLSGACLVITVRLCETKFTWKFRHCCRHDVLINIFVQSCRIESPEVNRGIVRMTSITALRCCPDVRAWGFGTPRWRYHFFPKTLNVAYCEIQLRRWSVRNNSRWGRSFLDRFEKQNSLRHGTTPTPLHIRAAD